MIWFLLKVWTWGKGDYYRLGHGCDAHVRRPTIVEALRGRKVIHVAVGALHCLAVTSENQVCPLINTAWIDLIFTFEN